METIASTTVAKSEHAESIFTLRGVSWKTYKALMAALGDDRDWRFVYDGEILELRMPVFKHEITKGMLASFVATTADEMEIEIMTAGALTLEREDLHRASEPDIFFYIQNESRVRSNDNIELPEDPPPALAIESVYGRYYVNKFDLYASLQVPEFWRDRNDKLEVYHLVEGKYELRDRYASFSFLADRRNSPFHRTK